MGTSLPKTLRLVPTGKAWQSVAHGYGANNFDAGGVAYDTLTFDVKFKGFTSVEMKDGTNLRTLVGNVRVYKDRTNRFSHQPPNQDSATLLGVTQQPARLSRIGTVEYSPESTDCDLAGNPTKSIDAGYYAEFVLQDQEYDRVATLLSLGILPCSVDIDCLGLEYGWEPDGSGKTWDETETPVLSIIMATVAYSFLPKSANAIEDEQHSVAETHDSTHVAILTELSAALLTELSGVRHLLRTMVLVVMVGMSIMIFRS